MIQPDTDHTLQYDTARYRPHITIWYSQIQTTHYNMIQPDTDHTLQYDTVRYRPHIAI